MGVSEQLTRAGGLARERPARAVVAVVGVLLLVDLLTGMATGRIPISGVGTLLWDGIVVGMLVGLAGIGLSMTYSILNFANFSHGDMITSGAFVGWVAAFLVAGWGRIDLGRLVILGGRNGLNAGVLGTSVTNTPLAILVGFLVAVPATIALALLIDRIVYRPMRDQGAIALLIASIGVALALRYLIAFVFQSGLRPVTATNQIPGVRIPLGAGTVNVDAHEVTLVVVSLLLMLGVHLLLQRTKLGTAMRAMADNEDLALVTGIPTERVVRATWVVGGGLTGAAGFLVALERGTIFFQLGWILLLLIFAAVILGGIGSIYGAIAGGLVIGLVSRISLVWIPADFGTAAAFVVMILVLLFRPTGLFGGVTTA